MSINQGIGTKKRCIHKYLSECRSISRPPGLADFLRGTITLFKYSQEYNYDFFIDKNIHPFFSFLEDCQYYVYDDKNQEIVHEVLDNLSWPVVDEEINKLFRSGEDFSLITNGFYTKHLYNMHNEDEFAISNFGCIPENCKNFIRTLLRPNDFIKARLDEYYKKINLNRNLPYIVIHLRFGDNYIFDGFFDLDLSMFLSDKIKSLMSFNQEKQFIIISDSLRMAKSLKEDIPTLFYNETNVIHMGENNNANIEDTVVDFFVMSKAKIIFSINDSGFSRLTSLIFDVDYNNTVFSVINSNLNIELNADNIRKYNIR